MENESNSVVLAFQCLQALVIKLSQGDSAKKRTREDGHTRIGSAGLQADECAWHELARVLQEAERGLGMMNL